MEQVFRLQINILCILLLLIVFFSTSVPAYRGKHSKPLSFIVFQVFILSTVLVILTDIVGWIYDRVPGASALVIRYTTHTLYYILHSVPACCYILYADLQLNGDSARTRRLALPLGALCLIIAAAALASPFTGFLFSVNEQHQYVRGSLFFSFSVIQFLLVGLSFLPITVGRKQKSSKVYFTLLFYPIPLMAAGLFQYLYYGLVLIWPATTAFLVMAALNIQKEQIGIDHLTGLSNRRYFDYVLKKCIRSSSPEKPLGCMLLDIDNFKQINDTLGHETGDRVLEDVAAVLARAVGTFGTASRFGGDEFALIVPDCTPQQLQSVNDRIHELKDAYNSSAQRPCSLAFSIGSGFYNPELDRLPGEFISRIYETMYAAKRKKRSTALRSSEGPVQTL